MTKIGRLEFFLSAAVLSLSAPAGAVVCGTTIAVNQPGTISAAVAAIPSPMTGNVCIDIQDGGTYNEQVTIQGVVNDGYAIYLGALDHESPPTIVPPSGSTAAVQVLVSSVSLVNVDIQTGVSVTYGAQLSADYDSLDGVNLEDSQSFISQYGVLVQGNWCGVTGSTISITAAVPLDEVAANGGVTDDIPVALFFDGASSAAVSQSYIDSEYGMAVFFQSSSDNQVILSTVVAGISPGFDCSGGQCQVYIYDSLWIDEGSNSNSIGQNYFYGFGIDVFGSTNTISASTATMRFYPDLGYSNCVFSGSFSCAGSYFYLASGSEFIYGLSLDPGAASNIITRVYSPYGAGFSGDFNSVVANSTVTLGVGGFPGFLLEGSSSDTIVDSYVQGSTAVEVDDSTGVAIGGSALVDPFAGGESLWFTGGSSNLVLSSDVARGGQFGLLIDTASAGPSVTVSSLTFVALQAGATAVDFSGGVFVATFSSVYFDASVAANVSAAALGAGSRVTMLGASGPRAGPSYENDPFLDVSWNWPARLAAAPVAAAPADQVFIATVTLTDGVSGAFIPGAAVSFQFEGSTAAATTNAVGQATAAFNAGLLLGTTVYAARFAGGVPYAAASASAAVAGVLGSLPPPTTAVSTPAAGGTYGSLPGFSGTSSGTVAVSTVALSLRDATAAAPNCYSPAANDFSAACPGWFAAQGATAAWTYSLAIQPWTYDHAYVLFSSATDARGVAQTSLSSAAFVFNSTSSAFYAGADVAPPTAVQGGKAALIRFTLSSPETGVALASVTVQENGTASAGDVSEVLLYRDGGSGVFDPGQDALVGMGAVSLGASTVAVPVPALLVPGLPQSYFVVYAISSMATVGDKVGALIAAPADVVLSSSVVLSGAFPTSSGLTSIAAVPQPSGVTGVSSYPNPADLRSGPATIVFTLAQASDVRVRIMSLFGAELRELHLSGIAGRNAALWDGADASGKKVGMGVYLAVIDAAGGEATYKIAVRH